MILLIATGIDANDHALPLSWAMSRAQGGLIVITMLYYKEEGK